MTTPLCPQCKRDPVSHPRAIYCSARCRMRAHQRRLAIESNLLDAQPPAPLPPDLDAALAHTPERPLLVLRHTLLGRAPAFAVAYRLGIRAGHAKTHRWFPPKRSPAAPTFRLHPFEFPRLPLPGLYTIVYFDAAHTPLGGPLHNVVADTDTIDPALNYSDGDRGWRLNPP